jgi:hypothetical protein
VPNAREPSGRRDWRRDKRQKPTMVHLPFGRCSANIANSIMHRARAEAARLPATLASPRPMSPIPSYDIDRAYQGCSDAPAHVRLVRSILPRDSPA